MATAGVPLWSTTAASNATADPAINWAEGQAPSTVNDSARGLMASVAKWRNDLYGITTGGTSTAYTVTTGSTFAAAADMSGVVFCIVPNATSGASPTLAVDGLTARAINISTGVAVPTGALISGTPYLVKYVHATTEFILVGTVGVQLLANLNIIGATQETAIALTDTVIIYDVSATANRRMLVSDFLKVINALTEDTSPDAAADFVATYDTSGTAAKKVKLQNLPSSLPRGYIDGLYMGNGNSSGAGDTTNDITVFPGVCRDSTNTVDIVLSALQVKQLDANWATGSNAGMRNSAAGITDTTYWIYAVRTAASSAAQIYAHTSTVEATVLTALQAETGGTDYIYARCIGGIIRSGSTILAFKQNGDNFTLSVRIRDVNNTSAHTTAQTVALSIPIGRVVEADLIVTVTGTSSPHGTLVTALTQADSNPGATNAIGLTVIMGTNNTYATAPVKVYTDTSGQIRYRASDGGVDTMIYTAGWRYDRSKDA